ncbi:MAG: type IV pilin protein [Microcystaceae cyanobacterium]
MLCLLSLSHRRFCLVILSIDQKSDGFTLIELMIVIIILGMLSAIAIPSYVATVDKFRYGHAKAQMGCLKREILGYQAENGDFPVEVANGIPSWSECFSDQDIPFESAYDYNQWQVGESCYIGITFLGKDQAKESADETNIPLTTGFLKDEDDLIFSIGIFDYGCTEGDEEDAGDPNVGDDLPGFDF